jgi:ribonuclease/clavin/mitogillin
MAGAREALEELGLRLCEPPRAAAEEGLRGRTVADPGAFARRLRAAGAQVPGERFHPLLQLLTPPFSPIRYDTVFFRIDLDEWSDPGAPTIVPGELVEGRWDRPDRWLGRWERGDLLIAPPVVLMLEILREHGHDGAQASLDALAEGFRRGRIHPIFYNPAVQLLPLRTPTLWPATHTNAYLVGRDPAYLVDPATPHAQEQAELDASLDEAMRRGRRLAAILLTHHHPDHVGAVLHVRERLRLPVWAHAITRTLLDGRIPVDRTLDDGDRLPLGVAPNGEPWELEVLFTPGHAAGHLCFFERAYGSLVVGDMISTLSSILIDPADGDMADYLRSLQRLTQLPSRMVFPAHGPATNHGPQALQEQLEHRHAREQAVLEAIAQGCDTVASVVRAVYRDVPASMHEYAALSVRSILAKVEGEGRVQVDGDRLRPV